jgi:hypothetical protein
MGEKNPYHGRMKFLQRAQPPGEVIQYGRNTPGAEVGETDPAELGTGKRVQVPKEATCLK